MCSAYEGQIVVRAQYPTGCDKRKFEDELRTILTTKNRPLCAWEKIVHPDVGTFVMLAEYHDASNAKHAAQQLNGKVVGVCTCLPFCNSTRSNAFIRSRRFRQSSRLLSTIPLLVSTAQSIPGQPPPLLRLGNWARKTIFVKPWKI